jgi:hypothetical protein
MRWPLYWERRAWRMKEVAMLSLPDIRYWLMLPFAIAVLVMLWILWHLLRESRRK